MRVRGLDHGLKANAPVSTADGFKKNEPAERKPTTATSRTLVVKFPVAPTRPVVVWLIAPCERGEYYFGANCIERTVNSSPRTELTDGPPGLSPVPVVVYLPSSSLRRLQVGMAEWAFLLANSSLTD